MLRRVALVRTDVCEELSAFIIRVTRIGELGTTLAETSNRRMLRRNIYNIYLYMESSCELGDEPSDSIKSWEPPNGCTTCGLSSGIQLHRVS
jgi:hypothetical protein